MSTFSQSETAALLACPMRWAFAYGDVAGFPLRAKAPALRLREGKAWGAAWASFHAAVPDSLESAGARAGSAMIAQLDLDAAAMEREGMFDPEEYDEARERLVGALAHYASTATRLNLIGAEVEIDLPHADGWVYRCHIDGVHQDEEGYLWVAECKWRPGGKFTSLAEIVLWRQVRWYAIALAEGIIQNAEAGPLWNREVAGIRGVIVDERLGDAPNPVRYNKNGDVSATQSCTLEQYMNACAAQQQVPHPPTIERLGQKVWQQRHEVVFRADELDDALHELESAATLVTLYQRKTLRPLRVPGRQCATCQFLDICPTPNDSRLRDSLYIPATEHQGDHRAEPAAAPQPS